ncbi:MAG: excinuclease ABC subunit UvrA [Desulfobacterota bacterium]|nr:excinuclease ABC subunit UvrA [Thermodesulfobacteriota bacterium]
MSDSRFITVKGARVHNLKNIDVSIPKNTLVVITGKSGSGKSSLAFDTLYAEGQRRYVESLSSYTRHFFEQMQKPDVDAIDGLSPAIAIEQRTVSHNPRSTVATITEIYDFLRVLYAHVGTPFCYRCGKEITSQTIQEMIDRIMALPAGEKMILLSPVIQERKGEHKAELRYLQKEGFIRARIDGMLAEISDDLYLDKNRQHTIEVVVDRLVIKAGIERRLADSLQIALQFGSGHAIVVLESGDELHFNERLACRDCKVSYPEISPRTFSFNSPYGACPTCLGLGTCNEFDPQLVIPDPSRSLNQGALFPWGGAESLYIKNVITSLSRHFGFSLDTPFYQLPPHVQSILLYGSGDTKIPITFHGRSGIMTIHRPFQGILNYLLKKYRETESDKIREELSQYMRRLPCPECGGARLRRESLAIKIEGKSIADICSLTISTAYDFFLQLCFSGRKAAIAEPLLKEIRNRLAFLVHLGLSYLTLDRLGMTLSGGEAHRIRLATQLGSSLSGVLYVLDEPSIGLHARDNERLVTTLKTLRDQGNTVIVVEHDEYMIRSADYIIDMGPDAGESGGYVVATGTPSQIATATASVTGCYLSGKKKIPLPHRRRVPGAHRLIVSDAAENNLKHITVAFPLGLLICVTGVSGSGKSTLMIDTVYRALASQFYPTTTSYSGSARLYGTELIHAVVHVDQLPIGRTPRSNPATFTGVFDHIRELFAALPESRIRGYRAGRFSFNVKGGRCEACQGDGLVKIAMHFMPDMYVTCDVCGGKRYNRETIEITYRGRSIADILDMSVGEALAFFENIPRIRSQLQILVEVGLEYIKLGQQATTLSGGEAQRIKLARELGSRTKGHTLYILDEPTTGLHVDDVSVLLRVLNRLVDKGNTVVVIEHHLDIIKCADYIIDLGPEGGDCGGTIVATGTPEEIAQVQHSHTGRYIKRVLEESA